VPEGLLSPLTTFPVNVEIVVAERPHDPSSEPVRLGGEAMDQWAGSLAGMFDFNAGARSDVLILDPATGVPAGAR